MTVNNGLRYSAVYNVHEELNYLFKGLKSLPVRYKQEFHPVVIFDNLDSVVTSEDRTKENISKEVLQNMVHILDKFAVSVSHDTQLAHVIIIASDNLLHQLMQKMPGIATYGEVISMEELTKANSRRFLRKFISNKEKLAAVENIITSAQLEENLGSPALLEILVDIANAYSTHKGDVERKCWQRLAIFEENERKRVISAITNSRSSGQFHDPKWTPGVLIELLCMLHPPLRQQLEARQTTASTPASTSSSSSKLTSDGVFVEDLVGVGKLLPNEEALVSLANNRFISLQKGRILGAVRRRVNYEGVTCKTRITLANSLTAHALKNLTLPPIVLTLRVSSPGTGSRLCHLESFSTTELRRKVAQLFDRTEDEVVSISTTPNSNSNATGNDMGCNDLLYDPRQLLLLPDRAELAVQFKN
jgi:hypothetical protein